MRWAIWWFAIFAAYVITVLTENGSEIIAGAIIAALAVIIVAFAQSSAEPGVRARWGWTLHLVPVPLQMVRDAFVVSGRILASLRGGTNLDGYFMRLPYDPGDRDDAMTYGREGIAIFGISAAPNSVVADVDMRGTLLIHKLVAAEQPHESPQWPL